MFSKKLLFVFSKKHALLFLAGRSSFGLGNPSYFVLGVDEVKRHSSPLLRLLFAVLATLSEARSEARSEALL